jgi:hypothetical protein
MADPYSLSWFLLNAKQTHLGKLLHGKNLLLDVPFGTLVDGDIGRVETAIQKLAPERREECEATFFEIYRMASRAGRDAIIAASRSRDVREPSDADLLQRLGAMDSYLDAAFWTYLYRPQYWEIACYLVDADALGTTAWDKHPKVSKVAPHTDPADIHAFAHALGRYFHLIEGRGDRCQIKICDRPERLHLFCFLEAPPYAIAEWQPEGLRRRPHKPVQPLTFMYCQEDGELDVYFKGKPGVIWDLMSLFSQHILGQKRLDPPPRGRGAYRLDAFKHRGGVQLAISRESGIDSVGVRKLRLTPHLGPKCHITIEGIPKGDHSPVYDALEGELGGLGLDDMDVTQVELAVKFGKSPFRKQQTIYACITVPNRCSLAYDDRELIVRRMLIASGIEPKDEDGTNDRGAQ